MSVCHSLSNGVRRRCLSLAQGITWGKVVSMFAVGAGLAVDCVRQGRPATVHVLVDSLGQLVRRYLVPWLKRKGGWVSECNTEYADYCLHCTLKDL